MRDLWASVHPGENTGRASCPRQTARRGETAAISNGRLAAAPPACQSEKFPQAWEGRLPAGRDRDRRRSPPAPALRSECRRSPKSADPSWPATLRLRLFRHHGLRSGQVRTWRHWPVTRRQFGVALFRVRNAKHRWLRLVGRPQHAALRIELGVVQNFRLPPTPRH